MLEEILKKATLIDVLIIFIASIGIIAIWRGTWNLLDKYLFPEQFLLSQIVSILLGVLILVIISRKK